MRGPAFTSLVALALGAASASASAEVLVPEREVETVRANYNAGNYPETLKRAQEALASPAFSDEQRVEVAKYAALSASILGDRPLAEKLFVTLLQLNPDYVLDPFAVAPPVIKQFEEIRKKNADALSLVRKQLAMREAEAKREAEKRKAAEKLKAEEELRRLQALSTQVTVRTVEKPPLVVTFLPFGAGQFQQKRFGWGIALAASESALAITSVVAFVTIESLFVQTSEPLVGRLGETMPTYVKVRRIPKTRQDEARVWDVVKWTTGIAFYVVWAAGIIDALVHHNAEVITVTHEKPGGPSSRRETDVANPGVALSRTRAPDAEPRLFLFPTTGGIGAGVAYEF